MNMEAAPRRRLLVALLMAFGLASGPLVTFVRDVAANGIGAYLPMLSIMAVFVGATGVVGLAAALLRLRTEVVR